MKKALFTALIIAAFSHPSESLFAQNANAELAFEKSLTFETSNDPQKKNTKITLTQQRIEDLEGIAKTSLKNGRKFGRYLKKEARWSNKADKQIEKSTKRLDFYATDAINWGLDIEDQFSTLEACEANEKPDGINRVSELHGFMMDMASYYQLLKYHWADVITPPCGERIENVKNKISNLIDERNAIVDQRDILTIAQVKPIERNLFRQFERLQKLYKDSLPEELNGKELYQQIGLMNFMLPEVHHAIGVEIVGATNATIREALARYYAAIVLESNDAYVDVVNLALSANRTSLIAINTNEEFKDKNIAAIGKSNDGYLGITEDLAYLKKNRKLEKQNIILAQNEQQP